MGIHTPLPPHRRVAIEAEIAMHLDRVEALIARLDLSEPDTDLEDDDPAGGNIEDEPHSGDWEGILTTLPRYGLDQSTGPANTQEANKLHLARLNGLVPNGRGGWVKAS